MTAKSVLEFLPSRRALLKMMVTAAVTPLPLRLAYAETPDNRRLVLVILRGGLDGLAAVAPLGDPDYRRARGTLAMSSGDAGHALGPDFALHPAFDDLGPFWHRNELAAVHALALPHRTRSHFDAQDLLETGLTRPASASEGWLNRTIAVLGGGRDLGLGAGASLPLVLRGQVPVATWAPPHLPAASDHSLQTLALLYGGDPRLSDAFARGLHIRSRAAAEMPNQAAAMGRGRVGFDVLARGAGALLAAADGPRIAVLETGGFDTHAGQGSTGGRLQRPLRELSQGLTALSQSLGPAWRRTVVVAVSEFGRTVAPNGTGGTDHGTAGVALLLGGAVAGGRVITRWPGLSRQALYAGRDLAPTIDVRALFKGLLHDHLRIARGRLDSDIFPDSAAVPAIEDLVRA